MKGANAIPALLVCLACACAAIEALCFDWPSFNGESVFTKNREAIMSYASHGVPPVPKVAFINIDDFPETRDALGIKPDDNGPFVMLMEDYTFYDLNGDATTIRKGFVFDGASFPKETWKKFLIHGVVGTQGSAFDPTVLAAGLIHDYMYRNPGNNPLYTQEYADMMIAVNAAISGNKSAWDIWAGLRAPKIVGGGVVAYTEHEQRRNNGDYAIFTGDYYSREFERYVALRDGWTSDQLFRRGGPSMSEETRRLFNGGETDSGGTAGEMVCRPGDDDGDVGAHGDTIVVQQDGLHDGSGADFYSSASGADISIAAPCIPYRRTLYLFSGDFPGPDDFKKTYSSALNIVKGGSPLRDDLAEYEKMRDTMRTMAGELGDREKMWESTKDAWDALRKP